MIKAEETVELLSPYYEKVGLIKGSTFKDNSTIFLVPTRGLIHPRIVNSWMQMISPINSRKIFDIIEGDEVGVAYNKKITSILNHPQLSKFKYIMTMEDDNIPPRDAHIRLLESIENYDAVSGLYFFKDVEVVPMVFGNPKDPELEFRPLDIREAWKKKETIECNGIPMGCALWRMDLFKEIAPPWFITMTDIYNGRVATCTQDLSFCYRARQRGKRFAVDTRVSVGHMDTSTGEVY